MNKIYHVLRTWVQVCKNKRNMYFLLAVCLIGHTSCRKFVEVPDPVTQISADRIFEDSATAFALLSNIYTSTFTFSSGGLNSITYVGLLSADESDNYSSNLVIKQVSDNQLLASNSYATAIWQSCYNTIYLCNIMLDGTKNNTKIEESKLKIMRGEALFFRAFCHLYLTSLYGNVPWVTSTDYRINTVIHQSKAQDVRKAVIEDLLAAIQLLPNDYSLYNGERIRANKWAAKALLARCYLYDGQYENAELTASGLIENNELFALNNLSEVFLKNSRESILQLKNTATTINTNEGNIFILTAKPSQVALRNSFYDGFEIGDQRKANWIGKYSTGGVNYYFPYKYKVKIGSVITEYSMVLRLAEQYLIRAEALAQLGDLDAAITDLDKIRVRAGLTKIKDLYPNINKEQLLELLLSERKAELFSEWGHRWLDLKRMGKIDAVMKALKPTWLTTAQLFPIPSSDILVNVNLKQNEGY